MYLFIICKFDWLQPIITCLDYLDLFESFKIMFYRVLLINYGEQISSNEDYINRFIQYSYFTAAMKLLLKPDFVCWHSLHCYSWHRLWNRQPCLQSWGQWILWTARSVAGTLNFQVLKIWGSNVISFRGILNRDKLRTEQSNALIKTLYKSE